MASSRLRQSSPTLISVCFYINPRWCSTIHVREKLCTPNIKLLAVLCCPFYLPREFPQLFPKPIFVYIHPRAKPTMVTGHIRTTLNKLEQLSPDYTQLIQKTQKNPE